MASCRADTIAGFNAFLESQRNGPDEASISLMQFDDEVELVYQGQNVNNAAILMESTFVPRGNTALMDAVGQAVKRTEARLESLEEESRPAKVIIAILTDGEENASREFNVDKINEMIREKRALGWEFVFLAANQDAITSASKMGIRAGASLSIGSAPNSNRRAYQSFSNLASSVRGMSVDHHQAVYCASSGPAREQDMANFTAEDQQVPPAPPTP